METTRSRVFATAMFLFLFSTVLFMGGRTALALELGKTYDQTNYQEIEELLIYPLSDYVKKGEFVIPTGKLAYEWKMDAPVFVEATRKNVGKYDLNTERYISV